MVGSFQKAKISNEDVTDDFKVKGCGPDVNTDDPDCITYTEENDKRCLDAHICNVSEFPGGSNNLAVTPCYSSKKTFDFDDTVVPLTASFVDQYSYTGTGKFIGFVMEFTHKDTVVKLIIDGDTIFEMSADDLILSQGNQSAVDNLGIFWEPTRKVITYYPRFPICFGTDVKIKAKYVIGTPVPDRTSYMISIEKVT